MSAKWCSNSALQISMASSWRRGRSRSPRTASATIGSHRSGCCREAAGYTRAQVAIAICRSWGAVYQFERGMLTPGAEAVVAMADLFDCPIDAFYEATDV